MIRCLALLALLVPGCLDDVIPGTKPPCMESAEKSLTVPMPVDGPTQFQINQCRIDPDACTGLCSLLLMKNMIDGTTTSCDVRFEDTKIDVTVHYQFMREDAEDCPFFPPDGGIIAGTK